MDGDTTQQRRQRRHSSQEFLKYPEQDQDVHPEAAHEVEATVPEPIKQTKGFHFAHLAGHRGGGPDLEE